MSDFIEVNSTGEGYFSEDRNTVYCQHGTYIGYPGGADYMCFYCEQGLNTLDSYVEYSLLYLHGKLVSSDSPTECLKLLGQLLKIAQNHDSVNQLIQDIEFNERVVYHWTD
jgi:hypothetical protein